MCVHTTYLCAMCICEGLMFLCIATMWQLCHLYIDPPTKLAQWGQGSSSQDPILGATHLCKRPEMDTSWQAASSGSSHLGAVRLPRPPSGTYSVLRSDIMDRYAYFIAGKNPLNAISHPGPFTPSLTRDSVTPL